MTTIEKQLTQHMRNSLSAITDNVYQVAKEEGEKAFIQKAAKTDMSNFPAFKKEFFENAAKQTVYNDYTNFATCSISPDTIHESINIDSFGEEYLTEFVVKENLNFTIPQLMEFIYTYNNFPMIFETEPSVEFTYIKGGLEETKLWKFYNHIIKRNFGYNNLGKERIEDYTIYILRRFNTTPRMFVPDKTFENMLETLELRDDMNIAMNLSIAYDRDFTNMPSDVKGFDKMDGIKYMNILEDLIG